MKKLREWISEWIVFIVMSVITCMIGLEDWDV
jgi:hypothetical protein